MCQQCVDAVREIWPNLPEENMHDLLICATAYPFADAETIKEQLKQAYAASGGNLRAAIAWADRQWEEDSLESENRMREAAEDIITLNADKNAG